MIARHKRLKPGGWIKRRKRVRRKPRTAAESRRIYGTTAHQTWLRAHPCLGCARIGTDERPHHLHHTRNGGMGKKADARWQIPLCNACHRFVHDHGPTTFEAAYWRMLCGRSLRSWAETYADAWEQWSGSPAEVAS